MARRSLRPARFDDLGLRRALSDRLLPALVGAMTFLAALTIAGVLAAAGIAEHWRSGAAAVLTVQVPRPMERAGDGDETRLDRVVGMLRGAPGIGAARVLPAAELAELLRPWLGTAAQASALPLPGVVEVRLAPGERKMGERKTGERKTGEREANERETGDGLQARLAAAAPGVFVESQGVWLDRLTTLARSLQACAAAALLLVAGVGAAVIAIATRAGLSARRGAIEIVHGLGAADGFIAGRFAGRATMLAATGSLLGAAAALPVLLGLAAMAQPFLGAEPAEFGLPGLPLPLWLSLPALPVAAGAIGWLTAQATVRRWLRQLP